MSGPYRFTQDSTRSPLDRQAQNLFPPGQAPSFKTNVNRSKTKKWVEAKKNAYDGDDWGDYDEYDEYGVAEAPPSGPASGRHIGEPVPRSFTDPQRQGLAYPARRNSFEADEEQRSFSAAVPPAHHDSFRHDQTQGYGPPPIATGLRQSSAAQSDISDTIEHRPDFSPSAMVPPLQTRISQVPAGAMSMFPPRKSSIDQTGSHSATSPTATSPTNPGKRLPFIRPSDIYKRVDEERQRERASLDSSRPSLDSLVARPKEEPLAPVVEGKGEQMLPPLQGVGTFGSDFWSSDSPTQSSGQAPVVSPGDDQGLQSVVDQAFTRSDDQRSVPPTPQQSDVSRSNTNSTAGISPIMSRIPSSAMSALKSRNQAGGNGSTPVIAEETSASTPVAPPSSPPMLGHPQHIARKPSPTHSRNVSGSSVPQTGLATPTHGDSPARSPAIEPQKALPVPESAQLTSLNTSSIDNMVGGLEGPSTAYANREADLASAIRLNPVNTVPDLGFAGKQSQDAFLESHQNAQSPIQDATSRSRSESPSKGRVQALAGKFGDVSHSRRGSTQSNSSRHSVQSWERSQDGSRPSSPSKAGTSSERPSAGREASFRPKLPGQWESYATSIPTPTEQPEKDTQLSSGKGRGLENNAVSSPLGDVDLMPTTSTYTASATEPSDTPDPLSGVKAAGAAIGAALQTSLGTSASQPADSREGSVQDRSHGDVPVSRPVPFDRTVSSVSSSIAPTPPAKSTPVSEDPSPLEHVDSSQEQTPTRPALSPQLSTLPSDQDEESDRLRKEIVASLTPVRTLDASTNDTNRASLQPAGTSVNRDSSILPSEYDSYWAGEDISPQPSQDAERSVPEHASQTAKIGEPQAADLPRSSALTRFSWEEKEPLSSSPHGEVQTSAAVSSPQEPSRSSETEHGAHATSPVIHTEEAAASPPAADPVSVNPPDSGGLHVVNSAVNPEAVDMPPRLSAEASQPVESAPADARSTQDRTVSTVISIPQEADTHKEAPNDFSALKSPTDKPLGSREISNIKSSPERIVTYNVTREYWAKTDHGLNDWISSALATTPELVSQQQEQQQTTPQYRPQVASSSGSRHKATGSLSLFGKHHAGSPTSNPTPQASGTPTPSLGAAEARPHGSMSGSSGGKITSHQMQAKGKDLLHTAGVLGGKGMTGAKGLFAKGKSRFRAGGSDKVDK